MAKKKKRATKKQSKKRAKKTARKLDLSQYIILAIGIVAIVLLILFSGKGESVPKTPEVVVPVETPVIVQKDSYDFDAVYEDILALDKEHVTEWKKERLGKYMVPITIIDQYLEDLATLRGYVESSEYDEKALVFVDARIAMLTSQKAFQEAVKFGARGVVNEKSRCTDEENLIAATHFYNVSLQQGHAFNRATDKVLRLADVKEPHVIEIIGVNLEKPRFYVSPFGDIFKVIAANQIAINLCASSEEKDLYISKLV